MYARTYTYIKRSTWSLSLSIFHRLSFKHLFPRPVSEAGLHGRHSRLGRDPSTIESETRYRNLCARERTTRPPPPAKPRENPRLIAISPLCGLPRPVPRRRGVADDFRFREHRSSACLPFNTQVFWFLHRHFSSRFFSKGVETFGGWKGKNEGDLEEALLLKRKWKELVTTRRREKRNGVICEDCRFYGILWKNALYDLYEL